MSVIWHDIECGAYREDVQLWRALAAEHGDPVLEVGAGTGRVSLDLARLGHRVTALDQDQALVDALAARAHALDLETVVADAREFDLGRRFALCIVPMQTIQLLGGSDGRASFLACARVHLIPTGVLAIALSPWLEPYETSEGASFPLPDVRELDGVVYASRAVAVREDDEGYVLARRREVVTVAGRRSVEDHEIRLDRLDVGALEREAVAAGLEPAGRELVPATADYVGSEVVIFRA